MIYAREDLNVDQLKDLVRKVQTFSGAAPLHNDEVELIEWAIRTLETKDRTIDSLESEIFDLELQVKDFKDEYLDNFNYESKTVEQLKVQLREKGLKVSGTKDELIERLKKA